MKALVTGAAGFVGPHLVDHLEHCGDGVVAVDVGAGPDLRDAPGWQATVAEHRPDVIYHLAGWSDVGRSWREPLDAFAVNALGTMSILEAARRAGTARVVLISSADVYGIIDPDELPLTELHPVRPRSPYGASKQAAEAAALQYWRGFDLPTVIARPFNHLGAGQSPRFIAPAFAAQIAAAEQGGPPELIHGDLSPRRDLTDVRDVVRAYRLLAEHGQPGQVYNVCSGQAVAMAELLEIMVAMSDADIEPRVDETLLRPVDIPVLRGSHAKLSDATGWQPDHRLEQTLATVLEDARQRRAVGLRR